MNNEQPQEPKKKKTVSFSQFTNWYTCEYKWYRDYVLKEKQFEDNLIMSFGTAIHETIQHYLKTVFHVGDADGETINMMDFFVTAFKSQIEKKKIPFTDAEFNEFIEDGRAILGEFKDPANRLRYFSRTKWELLAIEDDIFIDIRNDVSLNGKLDIVLKERQTGRIKIIDFKTSNRGWNNSQKEDFTKTSQLVLYKAIYSKHYNIPLSMIDVEFFILKRKVYDPEKSKYPQTRIDIFKPSAYQKNISQVIQEFSKFVETCFTPNGEYNTSIRYLKNPGLRKKNCNYCQYAKTGVCDQKQEFKE